MSSSDEEWVQRIRRDLADGYDEELELDLEDRNLDDLAATGTDLLSAEEIFRTAPEFERMLVDKKMARLNCMHHLLGQMRYEEVTYPPIMLPPRERHEDYVRHPVRQEIVVPEVF